MIIEERERDCVCCDGFSIDRVGLLLFELKFDSEVLLGFAIQNHKLSCNVFVKCCY